MEAMNIPNNVSRNYQMSKSMEMDTVSFIWFFYINR